MIRVGITGHQDARGRVGWRWVRSQITQVLNDIDNLQTGITSLAAGTDQVFAECVVKGGGRLHVVLPFRDYDRVLAPRWRSRYERLLSLADQVEILPDSVDLEAAYLRAGERVIAQADVMLAVWDGELARGKGGTGEIVQRAIASGKPVIHINPIDSSVRRL